MNKDKFVICDVSKEPNLRLSEHFMAKEFACPCCNFCRISVELIARLELLRSVYNRPIFINSGYRCPKHNREIGGASRSRHLVSDAADIRIEGVPLKEFFLEAVKIFPRVGAYHSNFLHVDLYTEKGNLYWYRDAHRKYHYFYSPSEVVSRFL